MPALPLHLKRLEPLLRTHRCSLNSVWTPFACTPHRLLTQLEEPFLLEMWEGKRDYSLVTLLPGLSLHAKPNLPFLEVWCGILLLKGEITEEGGGRRSRQKERKVLQNQGSKKAKDVSFPYWLPLRPQVFAGVHSTGY